MSFHPTMPYGTEGWHRSMRATLPEGPEFAYSAATRAQFEAFAAGGTDAGEQRRAVVDERPAGSHAPVGQRHQLRNRRDGPTFALHRLR